MTATTHPVQASAPRTAFIVIFAVAFCHGINDIMQSLLTAIYPILKDSYGLNFIQLGLLTLTFQCTASLLQPVIGIYTDKRPLPYSIAAGMAFTLVGLVVLGFAHDYWLLVVGAALIGFGSAVFHPESSRVARLASGGRHGFAQSTFQVGGNTGQAIGPLLAAFVVLPHGQSSIAWFAVAALVGMLVLSRVGGWYTEHVRAASKRPAASTALPFDRRTTVIALIVLTLLTFTKNVYMAGIGNYFTFYLIHKFGLGGAAEPADAVPVPRRVGGGRVHRRADRRPVRREVRDLAVDPRRAAVCAGAALCGFHLDGDPVDHHWNCVLVVLFGDRGVRAGAGAGADRDDRRDLLRAGVRRRRDRRGAARARWRTARGSISCSR